MSAWLINGSDPASLGLSVAGFSFVAGGPSTVTLARTGALDAAQHWNEGASVSITRDGAAFFSGVLMAVNKSGSGTGEGQRYVIEDAWARLERTTYQEPWSIRQADYTGTAYTSRVVLGVNASGAKISIAQQITEVVNFAALIGIPIQAGSMPSGLFLWPSEQTGMSCADVIRDSLRYNPDWIPWIDHTTTTPTLNVTPRATATARSVSAIGCVAVSVTRDAQRIPSGVRIVYETATNIADEVYRTFHIDQAPPLTGTYLEQVAQAVAPAPEGMLVTHVDLQGMRMQIQKQQIVTRTIPTSAAGAAAYLKKKFPKIKDIADAKIQVTDWTRTLIAEPDDEDVEPIDAKMERLVARDLDDTPRELVRGNIAEWMRKRIGTVEIKFKLEAGSGATAEEKELLAEVPTKFPVTGTNAIKKVYKGVSGYQAGELAPVGVAAHYLATIQNGCQYSGNITMKEDDIRAVRFTGCKLNITGGDTPWATMAAPIHSVTSDLEKRETTLGFGPNPDYSVHDFLEFLRLLNKRHHTEWATEERTSDEIGNGTSVSARGDSVGPFDTPQAAPGGGSTTPPPEGAFFGQITEDGHTFLQGGGVSGGHGGSATLANIKVIDETSGPVAAAGHVLYLVANCEATVTDGYMLPGLKLNSATTATAASVPPNHSFTVSAKTGDIHLLLGTFSETDFFPAQPGNIIAGGCPGNFFLTRT